MLLLLLLRYPPPPPIPRPHRLFLVAWSLHLPHLPDPQCTTKIIWSAIDIIILEQAKQHYIGSTVWSEPLLVSEFQMDNLEATYDRHYASNTVADNPSPLRTPASSPHSGSRGVSVLADGRAGQPELLVVLGRLS